MNRNQYLNWASLVICAVLYFIWPTIHTMALTKLMLLCGATVGVLLWLRSAERQDILKSPWFIYSALLMAWVIFHAAFISQNGNEAWGELKGQWLPAYLAMLAGIGCALAGKQLSPRTFRLYMFAVISAQPLVYLALAVIRLVHVGHLENTYWGLSDHKLSLTFYADLLAALACAKIIAATRVEISFSRIYLWLLPIAMAFAVAVFSHSLNGLILVGGGVALSSIVIAYQYRKKISNNAIAAAVLLAIFALYALSTSSFMANKWQSVASDARMAVNIDANKNWQNFVKFGLPQNEQGEQVRESFYLRLAYATAGTRTIIEHPWGYGVTRRAFERLVQQKYPDVAIANSHNAYIDLVSAVGFPALLLLAMAVVSVYRQLRRSRSEWARPAAWMIGIVVAHWLLDPISRDHYFETFLFLIGLLSVLTMESPADHARPN